MVETRSLIFEEGVCWNRFSKSIWFYFGNAKEAMLESDYQPRYYNSKSLQSYILVYRKGFC
jgi:hypothetical protein